MRVPGQGQKLIELKYNKHSSDRMGVVDVSVGYY